MHVDYMLSSCDQRVCVIKRLRDQGLTMKYIHNVFQVIIVIRILYAMPARDCFLPKELSGRIDAYHKRCRRYGFLSKIECVELLFNKMHSSGHFTPC